MLNSGIKIKNLILIKKKDANNSSIKKLFET
jgi:hypothetical protein